MYYFASGDAPFFFTEQIKNLSWLPPVWDAFQGFGQNLVSRLWIDYPFRLIVKLLSYVGLSWFIIDKILWLSVFGLAVYSSYQLGKYILGKGLAAVFTPVIYVVNTYMLLLFSGGQLGVAFAYGFAPLVLLQFIKTIDTFNAAIRRILVNSLYLALLITFDLRTAYLMLAAVGVYLLLYEFRNKQGHKLPLIAGLGFSLVVSFLIHAFWILPTILTGVGPGSLGQDFINPGMLKFLSVADFPHALSLLHPNWPENLFGKVYFLQPEFLVVPVLAFWSLFYLKSNSDNRLRIIFFALLALMGAFFAKGVQGPLGGVYTLAFTYIPGFVMFRDPTKFYLFTAIGYSILIPFTLERFKKKILYIVFIIFLAFSVRAVFLGQVTGNFRPMQLPAEYVQLKNLLVADPTPSRTLWIPQQEKFAFSSDTHPILSSGNLFPQASVSAVIALTKDPSFMKTLSGAGVKYVIVPIDVEHRLFIQDYRFDPTERENLIQALTTTSLMRNVSFQGVAVFQNDSFKMQEYEPKVVPKQQSLANIGLIVSVISLALISIICFKL